MSNSAYKCLESCVKSGWNLWAVENLRVLRELERGDIANETAELALFSIRLALPSNYHSEGICKRLKSLSSIQDRKNIPKISSEAPTNYDLGFQGYTLGINAPALCVRWRKRLEGIKIGEDSGVIEWNKGWDAAQQKELKAKFPEMYS